MVFQWPDTSTPSTTNDSFVRMRSGSMSDFS